MRASWNQTIHHRRPELGPGHQTNWCQRPALVPELKLQTDPQLPVPEPPEPARRTQTHRPTEQERERQIRPPRRQEPDSWPVPPERRRGLGSRRRILRLPVPVLHRRLGRVPRLQRRNHRRLARGQVPRRPRERELRS